MTSKFTQVFFFLCSLLCSQLLFSQTAISVVPPSCYPGVTSTQQDNLASMTSGASPFATWKAACNN